MTLHLGPVPQIPCNYAYLAVDLFFLLSGVVIATSYDDKFFSSKINFFPFLKRRIIRVFPLYLLGTFIYLIPAYLNHTPHLWSTLGKAVFMLPDFQSLAAYPLNFPAWSLFFEFIANIIYGLFIKRLSVTSLLSIIIPSFLCLVWMAFHLKGKPIDFGALSDSFWYGLPRVLFSFFYGVLISRLFVKKSKNSKKLSSIYALLALCVVALILAYPFPPYLMPIIALFVISMVFPSLIVMSLFVCSSGLIRGLLIFLGEISFPLYTLHIPMFNLLFLLLGVKFLDFKLYFCASMIFVAFCAHHLIDTPFRRKLYNYTGR